MIEFCGELSLKCKKYILSKVMLVSFLSALIVAFIFLIPIIIASILLHWIFIIAIPVLIMIVLLSALRPPQKKYGFLMPTRVTIEDNTIISKGESFCYSAPIPQVKKVVDYGEWYHIYFKYSFKNLRFVCQKDLLVEGTLEEFEELFAGKIIRKIK